METRYFKTLVTAIELGSFSKAAERLNITQSAVSQRIKFLEEHFEQQLIDRSGPLLVATPVGLLVLEKAGEILKKEQELQDALDSFEPKKRLSLCCTPTFGMAFLSDVLNEFIRINSDVSDLKFLFLQPSEALDGLRTKDYDLAIIEHHPEQDFSGFDRYPLSDDELLFVASPSAGIAADGGVAELSALTEHRLYARRDGCSSKELLRKNLKRAGAEFNDFENVVVSDDLRFTIQAVCDGGGIAFVSRSLVAGQLSTGGLVGFQVAGFEQQRGRSVVLPVGRNQEPLINALLECVFKIASPFWRPQVVAASASGGLAV